MLHIEIVRRRRRLPVRARLTYDDILDRIDIPLESMIEVRISMIILRMQVLTPQGESDLNVTRPPPPRAQCAGNAGRRSSIIIWATQHKGVEEEGRPC